MIKETTAPFRNPRSVTLTKDEMKSLKRHRKQFKTNTERATDLKLDRVVYDRVMVHGTASYTTVQKIRERFQRVEATKIEGNSHTA